MYCGKCGQELSENDIFCSNCGNKIEKTHGRSEYMYDTQNKSLHSTKPYYKVWWFWVLMVLCCIYVMIAISEIGDLFFEETSSQTTSTTTTIVNNAAIGSNKDNPYVLNADTWYADYCEGTSKSEYLDKWVKVTGTVLNISDYGSLQGYYLVGGTGKGLVCWVENANQNVQYGQIIEFVGKVSVTNSNHIEISNGSIVSVQWPTQKPISPISISQWSWTRDYVGGVEWNFEFTNNTDKTVKYITMEWECYNAVGDLVYDEITGKSTYSIKYTGPLEAGETTDLLRNTTLFYSYSYSSSKLTKLQVEFMDGTIIRITSQGYSNIIVDE